MKTYYYLFYTLYSLFSKHLTYDNSPETTAKGTIFLTLIFNCLSIYACILTFFPEIRVPNLSRLSFFICIGIPFWLFFYLTLSYKGKWKKIISEYEKESEVERKKGKRNVLIYLGLTILFFIISCIMLGNR
jgi:hypothetical protein